MSPTRNPFYGKYRGLVTDNRDPNNRARIRARVPDVYGQLESGWALPSLPYAGNNLGLYLVPPVGAAVWIEFEHGDPDYPIWSGCYWAGLDQLPGGFLATPETKILKTDSGTITIDDTPGSGGITIETGAGMKIKISTTGIEITAGAGTVKVNGTQVTINDGALEVT
jgi:uncharacterized protein involved in type VI secretion and phage assembly